MSSPSETNDRTAIFQLLNDYHAAMVDARTDLLDSIVATDFSLVHITGYVQPKHEWFSVLRSGEFEYHRIDVSDASLSVKVGDGTASLSGSGVFNATINGFTAPWRLRFEIQLARQTGWWLIQHARYHRN
jgi:hypothetical protein